MNLIASFHLVLARQILLLEPKPLLLGQAGFRLFGIQGLQRVGGGGLRPRRVGIILLYYNSAWWLLLAILRLSTMRISYFLLKRVWTKHAIAHRVSFLGRNPEPTAALRSLLAGGEAVVLFFLLVDFFLELQDACEFEFLPGPHVHL